MPSNPFAICASLSQVLNPLASRTAQLEKHYRPTSVDEVGFIVIFHHFNDPLIPETSHKLGLPLSGVLRGWAVTLTDVASSGDTNVNLLLNGSVISTITVGAGNDFAPIELSKPVPLGSKLQTQVTDVGTDAFGLVCSIAQIVAVNKR